MTTVVDSSVLVAALVDSGREGSWAESTLAEGNLAGPELAYGRGQQHPASFGEA